MRKVVDTVERDWPEGARVYAYTTGKSTLAQAVAEIPGLGRIGARYPASRVYDALWDSYTLAIDPEHTHEMQRLDRYNGFGVCAVCHLSRDDAFPAHRTIDYGRFIVAEYWPTEWHLQGGGRGVVLHRQGGGYQTAYFEVFGDEIGFVRGEGATLRAAEKAAWAKVVPILACRRHEYEMRGYRNGGGFCKHCNRFKSEAFDVKVVGHPCKVCGVGTNWQAIGTDYWCEDHAQPRSSVRKAMLDGAHDPHPIEALFLTLEDDDDDDEGEVVP